MVNSRAKGIGAEQAVARYFRDVAGCPDARRSVAAGWRNGSTSSPDRGDIDGVPGLCVQVKNLARPLSGKLLDAVWDETRRQALVTQSVGIVVEKRIGTTDVGRWWMHTSSVFYVEIVTGRPRFVPNFHLVRVELGAVIGDLMMWVRQHVDTH
jgi:hypothetical protein